MGVFAIMLMHFSLIDPPQGTVILNNLKNYLGTVPMDLFIIISSAFSFILFIIFQILIFRYLINTKILKGLYYALGITSVFHFLIFWLFSQSIFFPNKYSFVTIFLYSFVSLALFLLLAFIFILAFLGVVTTSLRIQLLIEIKKSGRKGISYKRILTKYNKEIIIMTRIARLAEAGEIKEKKGFYCYEKHLTYFRLHTFALVLLAKIYNMPLYMNAF